MTVDDIDAQALKLGHANRVSYFLTAAAAFNPNNNDDKRGLAQALALRYSQAAHAEFRGVAPGQQYCDGCAGALVAGVSAAFRITTQAPLNPQGSSDKMASNNNNNNNNNLALKKNKPARKLSTNAIKRLLQRQVKLRARLTAQGVKYIAGHGHQDKKAAADKGKPSVDALGRKRRWLQCTCKSCDYKTYTAIEALSTTSSSSHPAAGAASKTNNNNCSTLAAAKDDTPTAEPAKKKRKKNSLVAKLAAQKQARSASSGFSLGLSDFLTKK
ncbi:hypothetical protein D0Z00_004367 [Geotrichum galactomycetum]|uniref:Uncharacterized protein n=1 Tax=Geotrichum galactomycetum TaxID=27317 RepID=A0ACB6UYM2_9ASCO|nr:hypothetical protein D0Z00_004367 [Geotrichum candidum]